MISKVGTSHADETHVEQKIRNATLLRHGVTAKGFHVNSIRQSRHRDILTLCLASRLGLGLGLGLRSGSLLPLVQDKLDSTIVNVRIVTVSDMATILRKEATAPLVGGARGPSTTYSRRGSTIASTSAVTGAGRT
eukprot:10889949-Heterocapsa_arctica.AAC.1